MLLRFILLIIILMLSIIAGAYIKDDPGYILIYLKPYSMEMTLWTGLIILTTILVLAYIIFSLNHNIRNMVQSWKQKRLLEDEYVAYSYTEQAVYALINHDFTQAENFCNKSSKIWENKKLNFIIGAIAAYIDDNISKKLEYLEKAKMHGIGRPTLDMLQAQFYFAKKEYTLAINILSSLHKQLPKHKGCLWLLYQCLFNEKRFDQIETILPLLKRYKILTLSQINEVMSLCYIDKLEKLSGENMDVAFADFYKTVPRDVLKDIKFLIASAPYRIKSNDNKKLERDLRTALQKELDIELLRLYTKINYDYSKQFTFLEDLLKKMPDDLGLIFACGKMAANLELWGKAESHFMKILERDKNPHVYHELAMIARKQDKKEEEYKYLQAGLDALL